ncbi:hypothetical protein NC796_09490 [Aliifodinibius sp. S!AR15-10]|uniref:hypothetical protein n=1 Tax=Aliifodinibius sp. S!AR15-10 TaxID=2950437 RepID=UPI0028541EBA|nr:hypothetical protein [Aliifodinibius sp. S!AR15-10]MDR8391370.1 hypothetical protein [Aliifodinibius sp. S!AR15-10]
MEVLDDINRTYKSPALSSGNKVLKWAIWVATKIRFNPDEIEALEDYDFEELISPLDYDIYYGEKGKELEIINSEIIDLLTEHEISARFDALRTELDLKLDEVQERLTNEFDFEIEE